MKRLARRGSCTGALSHAPRCPSSSRQNGIAIARNFKSIRERCTIEQLGRQQSSSYAMKQVGRRISSSRKYDMSIARPLKSIQEMCHRNEDVNAMHARYLHSLWNQIHSDFSEPLIEDMGASSETLISRIYRIENIMKGTNDYIHQLLGGGGEGSVVCEKGCRIQVDNLKEQVDRLRTEVSAFKISLNRLTALMTRMSRKLDDIVTHGN